MAKASKKSAERRTPTKREVEAMAMARERYDAYPARPAVTTELDGTVLRVDSPHRDLAGYTAHVRTAFGSASEDFVDAEFARLSNVVGTDQVKINAALATLAAIGPANELEAVLATQIAASHDLAMELMRRAKGSQLLPQMEAYMGMATKASRTMISQVEALAKLRNGGKQRVEVVYVDARGGQNVIGVRTGEPGGGGQLGISTQPDVPGLAFAPGVPLRSENATGHLLPTTGDTGEEAMPEARCQGRRSQG